MSKYQVGDKVRAVNVIKMRELEPQEVYDIIEEMYDTAGHILTIEDMHTSSDEHTYYNVEESGWRFHEDLLVPLKHDPIAEDIQVYDVLVKPDGTKLMVASITEENWGEGVYINFLVVSDDEDFGWEINPSNSFFLNEGEQKYEELEYQPTSGKGWRGGWWYTLRIDRPISTHDLKLDSGRGFIELVGQEEDVHDSEFYWDCDFEDYEEDTDQYEEENMDMHMQPLNKYFKDNDILYNTALDIIGLVYCTEDIASSSRCLVISNCGSDVFGWTICHGDTICSDPKSERANLVDLPVQPKDGIWDCAWWYRQESLKDSPWRLATPQEIKEFVTTVEECENEIEIKLSNSAFTMETITKVEKIAHELELVRKQFEALKADGYDVSFKFGNEEGLYICLDKDGRSYTIGK